MLWWCAPRTQRMGCRPLPGESFLKTIGNSRPPKHQLWMETPMRPASLRLTLFGVAAVCFTLPAPCSSAEKTAAERGRDLMFHKSLNPPLWSHKAYDNLWTQWGLSAKPADYEKAVMERYGLHPAPF